MKILDKYLLRSFAGTFGSVFIILFFIFILQTVWLFISELAGKDLDVVMVLKFLLFASPRIVPLVLPLSVLLASIMTFGSFAENYEFAAMKSSGISLQRAMKGLTAFILALSVAAFVFANNVIPYAEYKFINFRKDIAQMKPAMAIAEGQFSDVGSYNIKVNKKSGPNGNHLTGITIHKKTNSFDGSKNVIKAKDGDLVSNENSNVLKLILNNGYYYEDMTPKKYEERKKMPFAKSAFRQYIINLDLSRLNQSEGVDYEISNTNTMLNIKELSYTLDSLGKSYRKDVHSFGDNIYQRTGINYNRGRTELTPRPFPSISQPILAGFAPRERADVLKIAASNLSTAKYAVDGTRIELETKQKLINSHWIALYDKFVIGFACILMFFIGAPLGAIIRKGGLGLPIVFAVLIFIIYHFINTFGKKVAQENGIPPFLGCWMSSLILTPFAVLLTYRATNDQTISIDFDWLVDPIQKMFGRNRAATVDGADRIVKLAAMRIQKDGDWDTLMEQTDAELEALVFHAAEHKTRESKRIQALKILEDRGITQEALLRDDRLYDRPFEVLQESRESYRLDANLTFVLYLVTVVLVLVLQNNRKMMGILIPTVIVAAGYLGGLYKTQQRLRDIRRLSGRKVGLPFWGALLVGLPLYPLLHFSNRAALKKAFAKTTE